MAAGLTLWNSYFRIYAGAIKKEQVVDFLKALLRHLDQPLLIVWDRLPGHRSRLVQDYIASLQGCHCLSSALRTGTEPGRVHLELLETARVAECLP